ncbi:hypothetical protein Tco_0561657 [Tanacetum coccineum]
MLYHLLTRPYLLRRLSHLRPTKVARLLAIPTPPPSPLSPWSSPLPHIPSPQLLPTITISIDLYRTTQLHTPTSSTPPAGTPPLLPILLPTSSPPLHLLSTDCRADRPEVTLPPRKREIMRDLDRDVGYGITDTWDEMLVDMPGAPATDDTEYDMGDVVGVCTWIDEKRRADSDKLRHDQKCKNMKRSQDMQLIQKLRDDQKRMKKVFEVMRELVSPTARPPGGFRANYGFVATMDREIMRDLDRDVGYGITDTWDEILVDMPGAPATDDTELGRRMTKFTTRVRQDTDEIYTRLDDEQTERQLIVGRLNMLYWDRCAHARTARLMEAEAMMSREAWG